MKTRYWQWASVVRWHKYVYLELGWLEDKAWDLYWSVRRRDQDHAGFNLSVQARRLYVEVGFLDNRHAEDRT